MQLNFILLSDCNGERATQSSHGQREGETQKGEYNILGPIQGLKFYGP